VPCRKWQVGDQILDLLFVLDARERHLGALRLRVLDVLGERRLVPALADAYLDGAENSEDETRVEMLQGLAEKAIARLAWLRSLT